MKRGIYLAVLGVVLLGTVAVGTGEAQTAISADGVVESTFGGFKFPDGTVQMTAATPPGQFVGEFCWLFTTLENPEEGSFFRLGISHEGDGHYSVNGLTIGVEVPPVESPTEAVNGNMEIFGDELGMTLTVAGYGGDEDGDFDFDVSIARARLDGATLEGTWRVISILYGVPDGFFDPPVEYGQGIALFLSDCVVP